MRHVLNVGEKVRNRIENCYIRLPIEGVILDGAAIDQCAAVRQKHHAIAELVPRQ